MDSWVHSKALDFGSQSGAADSTTASLGVSCVFVMVFVCLMVYVPWCVLRV